MIVKIRKSNSEWLIFGEVTAIKCDDRGFIFYRSGYDPCACNEGGGCQTCMGLKNKVSHDLDQVPEVYMNFDHVILTKLKDYKDNPSPENPYFYNTIEFLSSGRSISIIFDTIVYICNNEGKTVEKFDGGSGQRDAECPRN